MKTIQLKVSETDAERYNLGNQKEVEFADLVDKISLEYTRRAVLECNKIAEKVALSDMTTGNTTDFTIAEFEYTKIVTPREYWDDYGR